jgi:hypothetical protein
MMVREVEADVLGRSNEADIGRGLQGNNLRDESLLIPKGIYAQDEFQQLFIEWLKKEQSRKTRACDVTRPEAAFA